MQKLPFLLSTCLIGVPAAPVLAQSETQDAYTYNLPVELALVAAREAVRICDAKKYLVTATVVNLSGIPQVVIRGDGATVHTGTSSFQKAYTVVTLGPGFGFDTLGAFLELVKTSPFAPGLARLPNVMALPGAVAIKVDGKVVAALGVGGAPGGDKDEVCAQAGTAKILDSLPK